MEVFNGAPNNIDARLPKEKKVYEALAALNIDYTRVDHAPADTMEDCIAIGEALGAPVCKNLFLTNSQRTKFYLLAMPGDKPFKTKDLSKQINSSRLSFAEPEYALKYLDITPGSVSMAGLINDNECAVQLLIDEDVISSEYVGIHPCINTSTIRLKVSDVLKLAQSTGHSAITVKL